MISLTSLAVIIPRSNSSTIAAPIEVSISGFLSSPLSSPFPPLPPGLPPL